MSVGPGLCRSLRCSAAGAALVVALLAGTGRAAAAGATFRPQEAPLWCWAAVTQMVLEPLDSCDFSQPRQADLAIEGCSKPPTKTCDGAPPPLDRCGSPGLPAFGVFGYEATEAASALPWATLEQELDGCRPVVFGWCKEGYCGSPETASGHLMVAVATRTCRRVAGPAVPIVFVHNPAPCCRGQRIWMPYATYETPPQGMKHWRNFYQVRRNGAPIPSGGTGCRASDKVVADPAANFVGDGDGRELVREILSACFPEYASWKASGLLEPSEAGPGLDGDLVVDRPVPRFLLSARGLASVPKPPAEIAARPELWVYPVEIGGRPVANVVLAESEGVRRLVAIEDRASARALRERIYKAGGMTDGLLEVVLVESGLPVLLTSGEAVVTTSDLWCRDPATVEHDKKATPLSLPELISLIAPP